MLSFPKRLIFGSQSKIDFKLSEVDGIARLYAERHIPYHDSKYWSRFLQLDSPSDVFSLLSLADLRRARRDAPENIVTLVRVLVAHLESLLLDPLFEPPPADPTRSTQDRFADRLGGLADVSKWKIPGASLVGFESANAASTAVQRDRTKEALNVVRVLTRTLPAVLESDDRSFEDSVLWVQAPGAYTESAPQTTSSQAKSTATAEEHDKLDTTAQFVIDDEDQEEGEHLEKAEAKVQDIDHPLNTTDNGSSGEKQQQQAEDEQVPIALGERLVRLVVDLLFCSGFTLPWTEDQLGDGAQTALPNRINYSIWEAGVGSSIDLPGTTRSHVSNRVEVLRLLLVLLSKSIYIPPHQQSTLVDPALKFAVQDLDRAIMLPLLCSLINTSITNARNSTSAWLGLPSVATGLVGGSNDEVRSSLVTLSLQILDVLLTYEPPLPGEADTLSLSTVGRPLPGPGGRNVFRFYLSKLHRTADFDFIWNGLAKSFNEHVSSTIQILAIPISIPTGGQGRRAAETAWQLNQVAERLVLLWRMLEHNAKFRLYVLDDARRAPELLTILLYFALTYKDNVALQGLVRMCAFMLQDVSSERAFGANLARPGSAARVQLPSRLGLVGGHTAIDYLVQAVYSLIAATKGQLASLYAPLVITLSNTAPVWRSLSITSSTRMMHLMRSFSQPAFLLSDEGHPRLLFYVLETINAVLTFGYTANVNLVYSLVLARQLVAALEAFELRKGVEEVWKKRRAVGTDTRDWFQNAPRLEKPPLPRAEDSATSPEGGDEATGPSAVEKGKMRRISTSSLEGEAAGAWEGELSKYPLSVVEEAAARYIGKNGFSPTAAWVESWHAGLPLSTLRVVIDRLVPDVERIAAGGGVRTGTAEITGGDVDARVLAFLREQQMAEYLPPPEGGIHARGWQWTDHATVWLRSYLWGTIYVAALLPFGLWSDTDVRLFRIHGRDEAGQPAPTQAAAQPQTPTTPSADTQSTTHT
ncbi:proteins containing regions of low-complexity [Moesziomyces antarcticus T-34]|uniref:Proteins containing regions of low-complexity n=1 Tax=Pseudozyma antarctica (strain T-34) TaxID=1151754 RepID=M9MGU7_PSEA3|nr:proteins containing regions of low-complexity [Moesziomyces antarcticus T-34]